MHTFFHGWRRKMGLATLVMACVVAAGRIRSPAIQDTITIGSGTSSQFKLISVLNRLVVAKLLTEGTEFPTAPFWDAQNASENSWALNFQFSKWVSPTIFTSLNTDLYTFGSGPIMRSDTANCEVTFCSFPYWFIDMPLTLLSAYLILWKPRKKPAHA